VDGLTEYESNLASSNQ